MNPSEVGEKRRRNGFTTLRTTSNKRSIKTLGNLPLTKREKRGAYRRDFFLPRTQVYDPESVVLSGDNGRRTLRSALNRGGFSIDGFLDYRAPYPP